MAHCTLVNDFKVKNSEEENNALQMVLPIMDTGIRIYNMAKESYHIKTGLSMKETGKRVKLTGKVPISMPTNKNMLVDD